MSSDQSAAMLIIGNEILSGRTADANVKFFANILGKQGIPLYEVRVVRDIEIEIIEATLALAEKYDYVFTTGGIGPTHDDITTASIAKAFTVKLELHKPSLEKMESYYGAHLNEARKKMAFLPEGSVPIETRITSAPGFRIHNVFVMAGVPIIAQAMLESVLDTLPNGMPVLSRFVEAYIAEGDLADIMDAIQTEYPDIDLGSYPFFRNETVGLSVVAKGRNIDSINSAIEKIATHIKTLGHELTIDAELPN
ncbi:MAG: competence/damage-inducible protein A [Rhodospirillaceae bacterium]|nr:competence/damage-inducible protein A [Rhodospirillaceae bacterium]